MIETYYFVFNVAHDEIVQVRKDEFDIASNLSAAEAGGFLAMRCLLEDHQGETEVAIAKCVWHERISRYGWQTLRNRLDTCAQIARLDQDMPKSRPRGRLVLPAFHSIPQLM